LEQRVFLPADQQTDIRQLNTSQRLEHRALLPADQQDTILQQRRLHHHGYDANETNAMDTDAIPRYEEGAAMMDFRHHRQVEIEQQTGQSIEFGPDMIHGNSLTQREQIHNNDTAVRQEHQERIAEGRNDVVLSLAEHVIASRIAARNERKFRETNNDSLKGKGAAVRYILDEFDENAVSEHYCGEMSHKCPYCIARYWALETVQTGEFTRCCRNGTIKIPPIAPPTPQVKELLIAKEPSLKQMRSQLRTFNNNISFSSIKMTNKKIPGAPSVPYFRMQGSSIHAIGALTAAEGVEPSFMQCFFLESNSSGETIHAGHLQSVGEKSMLQSLY